MAEPKLFLGRYNRVSTQIWMDPAFTSLPPDTPNARHLYLRLLAGPETTVLPGVITRGPLAIAEIMDWPVDATRVALDELVQSGLIKMDHRARLIYVRRVLADNPPANPNVVTGWESTWSEIPSCALKDEIWMELDEHIAGREGFRDAFCRACPPPESVRVREQGGVGKGSSNRSRNGNESISPNDSRNINQNQEQEQDQKKNPDQHNRQVPGQVQAVSTSGEGTRERVGSGACTAPGSNPVQGTWSSPPAVLNTAYRGEPSFGTTAGRQGSPGDEVEGPATMDDIDWDDSFCSSSSQEGSTAQQGPSTPRIPTKVQRVLDIWNSKIATPGTPFETVTGKDAEQLVPAISKVLEDPDLERDLMAILEVIPQDPWYAGRNTKRFVAFLRHYVTMEPERLWKCGDTARSKLRKLNRAPEPRPKSRSEREAQAARDRVTPPALDHTSNHLQDRLRS